MKKKLVGIMLLVTLVLISMFSFPAAADSNTKMISAIYGTIWFFPGPVINVSGAVLNIGKVPANNTSCTLSITGGFNNSINKTISYNLSQLLPKKSIVLYIGAIGWGPVKVTLTASATNANTTTRIVKGFQIRGITWIPLSLVIPGILQNFIPWLNWHPTNRSYDVTELS